MEEDKSYHFTRKELNSEKSKVLSKFASIVSHDLKNVVGGFSNIAYYLSKALKVENETQKKMLNLLSHEVTNLNQKIIDLLDMTRVKQITRTPCNLKDIITKAADVVKTETLSFDLNIADAKISADPVRMQQVFTNIFSNSKDAMKNSGIISVKMTTEDTAVNIEIKDTGCGMDATTFEACMDPMFSTKTAKAVGMGLPVAAQIVEMHNGKFEISSVHNEGTTVKILLQTIAE